MKTPESAIKTLSIMTIAMASHHFHAYLLWVKAFLAQCFNRFLDVKALLGAIIEEKEVTVVCKTSN